jgi:hypothetical protein
MISMAREQQRSGTKYVVIFSLVVLLVAAGFVLVKVVYPEALQNFATGFANQTLVEENQALTGQLNETQAALVTTQDERDRLSWQLRQEQAKRFLWPILIALLLLGILFAYLWVRYKRTHQGLTLREAEVLFLPRVRKKFGFSEMEFPGFPKITPWSNERVGKQGNEKDEAYFFIEYEFYPKHGQGYVRGLRSSKRNVVTVSLLNYRYEFYHRMINGQRLDDAIEYAHRMELWGFHLQKSQREDDINKLIQDAQSIKEIKKAVADEQEAA